MNLTPGMVSKANTCSEQILARSTSSSQVPRGGQKTYCSNGLRFTAHGGSSTCQITGATFLGLLGVFPNTLSNTILVEADRSPSEFGLDTLDWEATTYELGMNKRLLCMGSSRDPGPLFTPIYSGQPELSY